MPPRKIKPPATGMSGEQPAAPGTVPLGGAPATGQQFRQLVEQLKDYAFFMLGPHGQIASWNAGARSILGYRESEILGKHFSLFFREEDREAGRPERDLELARERRSLETEGWRIGKDGHRFWAAIITTALYDESGALTGFGKVMRDQTERHNAELALQKSRTLFEQLFENTPDAIVVVDSQGVIRKVNQQAETLFGYLREEMLGSRVEKLMPERYRRRHHQLRRGYFKEPRVRRMGSGVQLYGRNREGGEFPLDIMLSPMETEEGSWSFAVIRDITQQEINRRKISELTTALQVRVRQLTASNRELEGFINTMSHDLRIQLRYITGFVDLLNSRDLSALDGKSRHYLEVITEAAHRMGNLIDDLLTYIDVTRSDMEMATVDLDRLVREVVQQLSGETGGREIEWRLESLPAVPGDARLLRQALVNLIGNALKFTRALPRTCIEIGARENPTETLIHVRDNGVGFDDRYVNKLFRVFQRLHVQEEFEGTGVGLACVERIIARHGGKVCAEGTVGGGATLWFTLPKGSPPPDTK